MGGAASVQDNKALEREKGSNTPKETLRELTFFPSAMLAAD